MRFLSHITKFAVTIQSERYKLDALGERELTRPNVIAQFQPGDLTAEDLRYAEFIFGDHLNGMTYERDEVTPTGLLRRLSVFDTEEQAAALALLDEEWGPPAKFPSHKAMVEAKLLERQSDEMRLLEKTPVAAPWPRYDQFAGELEDLALRIVEDGYDISTVIAYEEQSQNRRELIELLQDELAKAPVTETVAA